jgi:O-acetyl-ADP-ribose deacetylase (regulator of RNase III)
VGVYEYPLKPATRIALATVMGWFKVHESDILVRFCCYSDREFETYMAVADELGIPYATNRQTVMRKEQQSE